MLTFDDGYEDFGATAFPELEARGWSASVFLPTELIGRDDAGSPDMPTRRFMNWSTVRRLSAAGIEFGGHGLTHADLTTMPLPAAHREIGGCKRVIELETGRDVQSFAHPYGSSNPTIRRVVAEHYLCSVGMSLGLATARSPRTDLPRIEMWYFCDPARWRRHLDGKGSAYLMRRRLLRGLRSWPSKTFVRRGRTFPEGS